MPPPLALALTLFLICYLLRRDSREKPRVSRAAWIPIIWLMVSGSRQVSQWFGWGPTLAAQRLEEGSSIDQAVYGALIVAGVCVLARRRVQVGKIVTNNLPIILFLLYEGLSVLWSDVPLGALRKWGKALGDPVMVLVLWSDPFPVRAITAAIKRCAYVLVPLSILFCKYYENWGRTFDLWGKSGYTGVTLDKNMFGYLLFAFGLLFVAAFTSRRDPHRDERNRVRSDQVVNILFLAMIGWLLPVANSKTATLALVLGIAVIVALRFRTVRRHFWSCALAAILLVAVSDELFALKSAALEASGRDATLTGRTGLWGTLLQEPINPLFGVGYASFWLGERLPRFWAMYPNSPPIEAHNGYLEVYLNLGLIGVCLIVGVLWSGLRTMQRRVAALFRSETDSDRVFGTFGMAYGVAYLFYNVTEATFQGLNFLFLIFLILAFDYRQARRPVYRLSRRFKLPDGTNTSNDALPNERGVVDESSTDFTTRSGL
jgi:exopolysaccharide production protein ExoQ